MIETNIPPVVNPVALGTLLRPWSKAVSVYEREAAEVVKKKEEHRIASTIASRERAARQLANDKLAKALMITEGLDAEWLAPSELGARIAPTMGKRVHRTTILVRLKRLEKEGKYVRKGEGADTLWIRASNT